MITVAAKMSCDEPGCDESIDVDLIVSVGRIYADGGWNDIVDLKVLGLTVKWLQKSYGNFCPKHSRL
jgi:hypothetical protein